MTYSQVRPIIILVEAKAFSRILGDCLYDVAPSHTARSVAEFALMPEVALQSYIGVVLKNDAYCAFIQRLDVLAKRRAEWFAEIEERPDKEEIIVERLLRLLGRETTRNLILAMHVSRVARENLPRAEKDKFTLNPQDQLKFALMGESDRSNDNKPGADLAFIAGWHYDLALAALRGRGISSKALEKQAEVVFRESLREGKFAEGMAEKMNNLELGKYALASALVLGLGRLLMEHFFSGEGKGSGFAAFQKEMESWGRARATMSRLGEPKKFITQQEELGSLFVSFVGLLSPIEHAVRYASTPAFLKKVDPKSYKLAMLLLFTRQAMSQTAFVPNGFHKFLMTELGVVEANVTGLHRKIKGGG